MSEAVAKADAMQLPSVAGLCRLNLASAHVHLGSTAEAERVLQRALDAFERLNEQRMVAIARAELSYILLQAAQLDAARDQAELAATLAAETPPCLAYVLARLTQVHLAAGEADQALQAAASAMNILETIGGLDEGEFMVRQLYADALLATGSDAREAIETAYARLHEVGEKISDARWRESFFASVPENKRIVELYNGL